MIEDSYKIPGLYNTKRQQKIIDEYKRRPKLFVFKLMVRRKIYRFIAPRLWGLIYRMNRLINRMVRYLEKNRRFE